MAVAGERPAGVGTVYCWRFHLPFVRPLGFEEVVTAWEPGRRFAYRAITDWEMAVETRMEPRRRLRLLTNLMRLVTISRDVGYGRPDSPRSDVRQPAASCLGDPFPALGQRDRNTEAWEGSFEVEEVSAVAEVTLLGGAPTLEAARRRLQRRYLARR